MFHRVHVMLLLFGFWMQHGRPLKGRHHTTHHVNCIRIFKSVSFSWHRVRLGSCNAMSAPASQQVGGGRQTVPMHRAAYSLNSGSSWHKLIDVPFLVSPQNNLSFNALPQFPWKILSGNLKSSSREHDNNMTMIIHETRPLIVSAASVADGKPIWSGLDGYLLYFLADKNSPRQTTIQLPRCSLKWQTVGN